VSKFSGRQSREPKHGRSNKGVMSIHRNKLREEADERNTKTPLEKRRITRQGPVHLRNK
jgi:hypothetical protein